MSKEKAPNQAAPQAPSDPMAKVAAELAAGRAAEPFDFSGVVPRTENMNDPELVILWSSRFTAEANSLGSQLIMKVARDSTLGNARPDYLTLSRLADDETAVAATPTLKESASTVPVRWTEDGTRAVISLQKLFTIRRFPIPRHTTVHIPISDEAIEGLGPSVILHLSQAAFSPIDRKERERAAAPAQGAAPHDPAQGVQDR